MKTTTIKILLLLCLLAAPWLLSAAPAMHHHSEAAAPAYVSPPISLDKVAMQGGNDGHYVERTEVDGHRCSDGGCSSVGCCVASDDYVPGEHLSSVNVGFITILASVTEVFLSSDTRPPIPSA
ncbi:MAG: hypothetical protein ACE5ET_06300 [Gammaproteobacteria bacterium]